MKGRNRTEFKVFKIEDWIRLFPHEVERSAALARVRPKIEKKIEEQIKTQSIGWIREKKVAAALEDLKRGGEIRDYLLSARDSYTNLIQGIDFIFIYVNGIYRTCRFSVTGPKWVESHLKRHPEIPVISVDLTERRESIQSKILALKNDWDGELK